PASPKRSGQHRLARLGHFDVALPALVFELDVLDRNRVRVGVEIGRGLVLGHPAAEHLVRERELPGFVVDLDDDVLAEILERDFRAEAAAEIPDLVRPGLEFRIVRDAAFDRDRVVLGATGRFAARTRVAAFAVLDHFGGAFEPADLADAGDVAPVPLHA